MSRSKAKGTALADRLQARLVRRPNGCLEWTGYINTNGYGQLSRGPGLGLIGTHRAAWDDAAAKGRSRGAEGLRNHNAKLTDQQVTEIRDRYQPPAQRGRGYHSNAKALALEFGITPQYVIQLVSRQWRKSA